ncbi:sigma-54-dependent Fis family transcriptional regulator [Allostella sp. ATCC 35155]|nr:sigma-54-dependent Fis family transcriptional regulator [Stella sp. ATCC 35155]
MSGRPMILVVEDDPVLGPALAQRLRLEGFEPQLATTGAAALAAVARRRPAAIISDIRLPDMSGETVHRRMLAEAAAAPIFFMTAFADVAQAVRLVKAGARDYLTKPVDVDALVAEVAAVAVEPPPPVEDFGLGRSEAMRAVEAMLRKAARADLPVLLTGETGVGKEVAANFLHNLAAADRPFVAVNCAAIPPDLMESTLFGHERGAFTGAGGRQAGLAAEAGDGTLFLDEIAELPDPLQAKLLRLVEERRFRPVGAARETEFHARLVFATHADLRRRVEEGRFREDLFYRIAVIEIAIPPLRGRGEDLAHLARRLLAAVDARLGLGPHRLTDAAIAALSTHAWPGNVRELRNRIERAAALAEAAELGPDDLFPDRTAPAAATGPADLRSAVDDASRARIADALRQAGGNRSEAARLLGISRTTLWKRMQDLGL